jgi:hypothetical protein
VKLSCAKRALSLSSLSHSSPGDTDGQFGDPPAVGERRGSRGEQWCEGDAGADPQGAAACGSYGVDTGSSRRWIGLPRRAADGSASPGEPRRRDVRLGAHDERLHPDDLRGCGYPTSCCPWGSVADARTPRPDADPGSARSWEQLFGERRREGCLPGQLRCGGEQTTRRWPPSVSHSAEAS